MGINKPFVSPITLGSDTGRTGDASNDLAIDQRSAGLISMDPSAADSSNDGYDRNRFAATVKSWRTYPATAFDRSHVPILHRALAGVAIFASPERRIRGDAATTIGVAIRAMRTQDTPSATFDCIMTAVLVRAIEGNLAAALVLAHALARLAVNEPSFIQLGASWRAIEVAWQGSRGIDRDQAHLCPLVPCASADQCRTFDDVDGLRSVSNAAAGTGQTK
jgi:hypothetical protein